MDEHYEDMLKLRAQRIKDEQMEEGDELKVGVFFCGAPVVGEISADQCRLLSTRGRTDGTQIEYHFMMEVFG